MSIVELPHDLETDRIYRLLVSTENRGARLTVINVSAADSYGRLKASPGKRLLVVATEWENIIPWTVIKDQQIPTAYKIPNLADHLYLVVDGKTLSRVVPRDNATPGHVPVRDFVMAKIGDRVTGNVVFEIPGGALGSAELRFYDVAHGHMATPLILPHPTFAPEKPLSPPLRNEVVEVSAYGVTRHKELNDNAAPEGMQYLCVDLRATSQFTMTGDATAFDPKSKPGDKMEIGTVADWTDAYQYIQLVVDGAYAYSPDQALSHLPAAPRFLPDYPTGGMVTFLAPETPSSLELRCDFPNAATPSGLLRPTGITYPLEGKPPEPAQEQPLVAVDDDTLTVSITAQSTADIFAGSKAPAGFRYVVYHVSVANKGSSGEHFQTPEQLKYVTAKGQVVTYAPASHRSVHPAMEILWIPAGQRRAFDLAFQVPATETRPRLAYRGYSKSEVLTLPRLKDSTEGQ